MRKSLDSRNRRKKRVEDILSSWVKMSYSDGVISIYAKKKTVIVNLNDDFFQKCQLILFNTRKYQQTKQTRIPKTGHDQEMSQCRRRFPRSEFNRSLVRPGNGNVEDSRIRSVRGTIFATSPLSPPRFSKQWVVAKIADRNGFRIFVFRKRRELGVAIFIMAL